MVPERVSLRKNEPFITLGILLKITGVIDTGGQAKYFLSENIVFVNNEKENRRGRKLYHGDQVQVGDRIFLVD